MRTTVVAVLALSTLAVAVQDPKAQVVKASRFELVDAEGRTRAVLGMSKGGSPEFDLRDAQGRPRALLLLDRENLPIFFFKDADVITRAKIELDAKGGGKLTFCDADLAPRLELDGAKPELKVSDPKGATVWKAP